MYAVITENDESQWADDTGVLYHFPKRYEKLLKPGTLVVYYKGKCKNKKYSALRLSDDPHYFGVAHIGSVYEDKTSKKGDKFAVIENFLGFEKPVIARVSDGYIEQIPVAKKSNYWRDGVRLINKEVFDRISLLEKKEIGLKVKSETASYLVSINERDFESLEEGAIDKKYVTVYERNPKLRRQAIAIHGETCFACGFNFKQFYGEYGDGYIHVHHTVPVSDLGGAKLINPETDMVPLCANCHAIVHRKREKTLSILELKNIINLASKSDF